MKTILSLILAASIAIVSGTALAQKKGAASAKQLVGQWSLVSIVNEGGGKKFEPFGPNPKGLFIFDKSGRYSIVITRESLPKIASNSREAATAEENKAIVSGSLAHFGTYKVNEKDGTYMLRIEASTFANWTGADQLRKFSVAGDELRIANPTPSTGAGSTSNLVLKRLK